MRTSVDGKIYYIFIVSQQRMPMWYLILGYSGLDS